MSDDLPSRSQRPSRDSKSRHDPTAHADRALAARYGVTMRSIRLWRAEGAPLDDETALRTWLAARGTTSASLSGVLGSPAAPPPASEPADPDEPRGRSRMVRQARPRARRSSPQAQGAAAALARLEADEVALWDEVQAATAAGDVARAKVARDGWLKVGDSLRKYDATVEQTRREQGSLVPREHVEKYTQAVVVNFIGSLSASLESAVPQLAGLPTPQAVGEIIAKVITRAKIEAIKNASERPFKGETPPDWLKKAIAAAVEANL